VIEPTIINLKSDIEKKAEEENVLIDKALARPIEIILKKGGGNVNDKSSKERSFWFT